MAVHVNPSHFHWAANGTYTLESSTNPIWASCCRPIADDYRVRYSDFYSSSMKKVAYVIAILIVT